MRPHRLLLRIDMILRESANTSNMIFEAMENFLAADEVQPHTLDRPLFENYGLPK